MLNMKTFGLMLKLVYSIFIFRLTIAESDGPYHQFSKAYVLTMYPRKYKLSIA